MTKNVENHIELFVVVRIVIDHLIMMMDYLEHGLLVKMKEYIRWTT